MPRGHKSQSEHDWAYAKRALARGDDPEVVIQRIADYRSDDKDNPDYYARRTVTNAQIDLERDSAAVKNSPRQHTAEIDTIRDSRKSR